MNDFTRQSVNSVFDNKISDFQDHIQAALSDKISSALEAKKIEVAQSMFGEEISESYDDEDDDVAKADRELARMKAKPIKAANINTEKDKIKKTKSDKEEEMDESYIEEKLDPSMGVKKYIDDFIKSDNPKFEGKSKKERIQMALGAYYAAKKANEEVEELDESYKVSPESKSYDGGEESVWHVVSHKGNTIGTIGTNFPRYQEEHGKWDFEDQAGNGRKQNEPKLNSKKDALKALINRHEGMLNQSKKVAEEAQELDELSTDTMKSYVNKRQLDMGANEKMQKKMDTGLEIGRAHV